MVWGRRKAAHMGQSHATLADLDSNVFGYKSAFETNDSLEFASVLAVSRLMVLVRVCAYGWHPRRRSLPSLFIFLFLVFAGARLLAQTSDDATKAHTGASKMPAKTVGTKAPATATAGAAHPSSGKAAAGTGAAAANAAAQPKDVDKGVTITGDFRDVIQDKTLSACHPSPKRPGCTMDACAEVLGQDYTLVGEAECLSLSEDHASLIYTTSQTAIAPVYLRLGKKDPPVILYDFALSKV